MGVRIITDSASDMSQAEAKAKNITVLPLTISFGEEEYQDGITINNEQFYERLKKKDVFPKTSQVSPFAYEKEIEKARAEGDEVLIITISSKVSGCFQSATIAREHHPEGVYICDSMHVCGSEYIIVELAVRLRDEGKSAAQIFEILEKEKHRARLATAFDTLEYLKLGGRLSNASAFIGTLFNFKPILKVEEGLISSVGKARGSKKANLKLKELIESFGEVDTDMPVSLALADKEDQNMMDFCDIAKDIIPPMDKILRTEVGATVGAHAGPGAFAFSFFIKGK